MSQLNNKKNQQKTGGEDRRQRENAEPVYPTDDPPSYDETIRKDAQLLLGMSRGNTHYQQHQPQQHVVRVANQPYVYQSHHGGSQGYPGTRHNLTYRDPYGNSKS